MKLADRLRKYRRYALLIIDIIIIVLAYIGLQIFIRDTFKLDTAIFNKIRNTIIIAVFVYSIIFILFKLYKNITRYESGKDYLVYIAACLISSLGVSLIGTAYKINTLNLKHNIVTALIIAMGVVGYRIILRIILNEELPIPKIEEKEEQKTKNLLIIGAGSATRDIIKSIKTKMKNEYNIVGIIDDNKDKLGRCIAGIDVVGDRNDIIKICKREKVDEIFFSISKIDKKDRKDIIEKCQNTGAKTRILPSTEDLIKNKTLMDNLRDIEIEDILGREPIKLDNNNISELINNRIVLVTGGGGSIGSELCRQIAKFNPKQLVIFDIYENNLYNIEMELRQNYSNLDLKAIVGSVRDKAKLENLFETYKPELVFHAAAHKHVPLMEVSPLEAIKNNVFGTYNVVNASDKYKVEKFVLISTDKAVNPTNIMGATKRICEMIIQTKNKVSNTEFVAVRFGNVLGSNGSVVPLFKKQIEKGGPVTVTHKDIIRYFMTIPEAVQLILQAITYANGGEIFVLDMGEPVKIYDLAVSLIKLSGLEPNVDIPIEITGLRPGEKLYEELLMSEEGLQKTAHNKIFVAEPITLEMKELEEKLAKLKELIKDEKNTKEDVKKVIKETVPTFIEPEYANKIKIK